MKKLTGFIKSLNKTQKKIIAVVIPILVVLVGFCVIGADESVSYGETGVVFNPVEYLAYSGGLWFFVVLLIGVFEFFWWKDWKKTDEQKQ
jgi:uncharacterized membrane protein (GlpM family)